MKSPQPLTFLFIFCSFWIATSFCFGQSSSIEQSTVPLPPTAAAFKKYTDIPVSHYTGVPNISIPIYVVEYKGLKVPVELSYHSGGNKNSDLGTWVGLGWSLQPGGMITREIRDKDDLDPEHGFFRNNYPIPSSMEEDGMIYEGGDSRCLMDYNDPSMPMAIADDLSGQDTKISNYDWAPDIFTFNFNGISGKFILNQDRNVKPKIIGESVVADIEYAGTVSDVGFIITTADGTKYHFLEKGKTVYTSGGTYKSTDFSWSLSKIVSPKGDNIVLNYSTTATRKTSITGKRTSYREKLNYSFSTRSSAYSDYTARIVCYDDYLDPNFTKRKSTEFSTFEPVLESIVSPSATVLFRNEKIDNGNDNDNFYRLNSVEVYTNDNSAVKKYDFTYDNFYDNIHREKGKLKLLSVQEAGKQPYSFEYYNNFSTKYGQGDHWGMYNGSESYDLPLVQLEYWDEDINENMDKVIYRGVNRETDPELLKAGIIKSITYPTGGKSTFEFEAHTYDAGLQRDNTETDYSVTEKTYHAAGNSIADKSLLIEGTDNIFYNTQRLIIDEIKMDFTNPDHWGNVDYLRNFYVSINGYKFTIFPEDANHPIDYSSKGDADSFIENLAIPVAVNRNVEVELNIPEGSSGVIDVKLSYDKRRYAGGLRVKKIEYNDNMGGANKVSRFLYGEQVVINGVKSEGHSYGKLMHVPGYYYNYANFYWSKDLSFHCQRLSLSSDNVNPTVGPVVGYDQVIVEQQNNGREEHFFLNEEPLVRGLDIPGFPTYVDFKNGNLKYLKVFSENGVLLSQTENFYELKKKTYDYGSVYHIDDVHNFIWNGGEFGICPVDAAGFMVYPIDTEWNVLSKTKELKYDEFGNNPVEQITEYKFDNPVHQNLTQKVVYGSKGEKLVNTITYPADYANTTGFLGSLKSNFIHTTPVEQVSYHQNTEGKIKITGGKITEYYDNGKGEVSKQFSLEGFPLKYEDFRFSNQEVTSSLPFSAPGTNYQRDTHYNEKATYFYDQFSNVRTIKSESMAPKQIIWGYGHTLPVAIVENAKYSEIESKLGLNFVLESEDGNYLSDSQIEALKSIPGAFVKTYTYKPLVGMTSQKDPNGITTKYEYDNNGRLKLVRDHNGNILNKQEYHYSAQ